MKVKVKELMQAADVVEARGQNDTIKLWESYREQASLWRAISLLQIPVTAIALVFAIVMYTNRSITLNVPARPLPGQHAVQDIPDSEFIDYAQNFVNLIATYQPSTVRRQFERGRQMLVNPISDQFQREYLINELETIEGTNRSQMFIVNPEKISVNRQGSQVTVTFIGDRVKYIAGRELEPVETKFQIPLITIPRNDLNPYGIVIRDLLVENTKAERVVMERRK